MLARKNPDFVRILSDYFAFLTFYLIVIVVAIGSCDMRPAIFFSFSIGKCSACVTIGISCVFWQLHDSLSRFLGKHESVLKNFI